MAFLRFTRDKRGYEHFYLVEPTTNRRGKTRPRVLYWFRTPPNVKVGRDPFDLSVRREIEAQNPGVQFDWRKIVETPIPSADVEHWRERRRAEKAEKAARRAEPEVALPVEALEATNADDAAIESELSTTEDAENVENAESTASAEEKGEVQPTVAAGETAQPRRRRRRGRRRRQDPRAGGEQPAASPQASAPEPPDPSAPHEPEGE